MRNPSVWSGRFAGILWKHSDHADKAARALRFTSSDLLEMEIVEEVVQEPLGGAHRNHRHAAMALKGSILAALKSLESLSVEQLLERRYQRFRRIGMFEESGVA